LAARVPEEFHMRLLAAAVVSGRNVSEELIWRARQSFEWETTFKSREELSQQIKKVTADSVRPLLPQLGFKKVQSIHGTAWLEPNAVSFDWVFESAENRARLQEMLDLAAMRAVRTMMEEQS
jgi:hypothetical protein